MKKFLFIFTLFALFTCRTTELCAQNQSIYQVSTIAAMKAYTGSITRIFVSATNRDYIRCTACDTNRTGVYAGALGRKWRQMEDSVVNIRCASGTTAANTAPIRLAQWAPVKNTTPIPYSLEVDSVSATSSNLYITDGSATRYAVAKTLTATATLDFPNTDSLKSATLTITVTGAAVGDPVLLGIPAANANTCYTAWVNATNSVTVQFNNYSSIQVNPASGTFRVAIVKY